MTLFAASIPAPARTAASQVNYPLPEKQIEVGVKSGRIVPT
jgi:hypothetical protein